MSVCLLSQFKSLFTLTVPWLHCSPHIILHLRMTSNINIDELGQQPPISALRLQLVDSWCLHHGFSAQTSLSDLHPNLIYPSINSSPIEPIFGVSDETPEPTQPCGRAWPHPFTLQRGSNRCAPTPLPYTGKQGSWLTPRATPPRLHSPSSSLAPDHCLFWQQGIRMEPPSPRVSSR